MQELIEYLSKRVPSQRLADGVRAVEVMNTLLSNKAERAAGADRDDLIKFPGWGAINGVLNPLRELNGQEKRAKVALESMLSDAWLRAARPTVLNAYYTPPAFIPLLWSAALKLVDTTKPIKVLEPGCGIGNFGIFAPEFNGSMMGVEIDPTVATMAKLIGWAKKIHQADFIEGFNCPDNQFDLAIGNVPFEGGVKSGCGKFKRPVELHARCFIRTVDLLKPSGLALLITSTGTMDSIGSNGEYEAFREYLQRRADFLGAIRLPQASFKDAYGTEVSTDIVVLRKRHSKDDSAPRYDWTQAAPTHLTSSKNELPLKVNRWYTDHPQYILGELGLDKLTGDKAVAVAKPGQDTLSMLADALGRLILNITI